MVNDVKCLKQHFIILIIKKIAIYSYKLKKYTQKKRQDWHSIFIACKNDKQNNASDIELDIMNFQKLNVILSKSYHF